MFESLSIGHFCHYLSRPGKRQLYIKLDKSADLEFGLSDTSVLSCKIEVEGSHLLYNFYSVCADRLQCQNIIEMKNGIGRLLRNWDFAVKARVGGTGTTDWIYGFSLVKNLTLAIFSSIVSRDGLPRGVLPPGILKMRKKCPGLKVPCSIFRDQ